MNYEELFDLELRIVVRYLKTIKNKKNTTMFYNLILILINYVMRNYLYHKIKKLFMKNIVMN